MSGQSFKSEPVRHILASLPPLSAPGTTIGWHPICKDVVELVDEDRIVDYLCAPPSNMGNVSMEIDRSIIPLVEIRWNYHHLGHPLVRADFIVGLGSREPSIIFSGDLGNWTGGLWHRSEVDIFAGHAMEKGVRTI
jgi:hypothetical protein